VRRLEADFAEGLTEERGGWLLSRTELRLIELAAARATSDPALR